MPNVIYLDNNATTALSEQVKETIWSALDKYYNPSALYKESALVKNDIDRARSSVATLINATPSSIYFNSGATEGNNTIINSCIFPLFEGKKQIIVSSVEHPAIMETVAFIESHYDNIEIARLPVDNYGRISLESLQAALQYNTVLVSIMLANNETGNIYPIKEFARVVHDYNSSIAFHTDATQAIGKMAVDVNDLGVDYLTMSGHKFHAPKGVGALFARDITHLTPFIHGGHQEKNMRAGTENVVSIIAMGKAAEEAANISKTEHFKVAQLRNDFEKRLQMVLRNAYIVGDVENRICNTSCVVIPGISGKEICAFVSDDKNICISSGSACDSSELSLSHVMRAMGIAEMPIRVSLSRENTMEDLINLLQSIMRFVNSQKAINRTPRKYS